MRRFVLVLVPCLGLAGCVQPMAPVFVSKLLITPPSLMVASKCARPLYIVVDPSKVPDDFTIPEEELKEIRVHELQTFVRRDLKRSMETYFQRVEVVAPGFAPPAAPHVIADVKIDALRTRVIKAMDRNDVTNVAAQIFGEVTWGFALRFSEQREYVYSFAGTSQGQYSMTHVSEAPKLFASAFEVALSEMLRSYTDKKVHQKLVDAERPTEP